MTGRWLPLVIAMALAAATQPAEGKASAGARVTAASDPALKRHPKVILDRLDLSLTPGAVAEESYLREVLAREARRADWGAGPGSQIEYRFRLDALEVVEDAKVVRVSCSASGWLPKSRRAKSHLAFGGAPKDRQELVHHVLEIVASGVVTRLAEMERQRRHAP